MDFSSSMLDFVDAINGSIALVAAGFAFVAGACSFLKSNVVVLAVIAITTNAKYQSFF